MYEMRTADEPVRVQALSGEPLSEELEAKIRPLWDVLWERAIREQNDEARDDLRAFAREILSEEMPQTVAMLKGLLFDARQALLASQETSRQLSEALENRGTHSSSCDYQYDYPGDPRECDCGLHAALVAYRSSEAGRGKP